MQLDGGTILATVLRVLDKLKECVPMMKTIWGHTPQTVSGRDRLLEADLKARDEFLQALGAGEVEMYTYILDPQSGTAV